MPDSQAIIFSNAPSEWRHFITQKKRHISASRYFPFTVKMGFGLAFITKFFIIVAFVLSLVIDIGPHLPAIFLFSYFPTVILMYGMTRKTKQNFLLVFYPLWEIYYLISHILLGPMGLFGNVSWGARHAD